LRPGVDLPRPVYFPFGIVRAFFPLGDPPGQAADGKHDREHVQRNADGPQNNAGVKIVQALLSQVLKK
jgi:hypothetical protein